jgi:hypothetical protein
MENLSLAVAGAVLPPPKVKKDRTEYFNEYNSRPEIKEKRKLARLAKEQQQQERENEVNNEYYGADAIKILMSLKEYTELNKEKKQKWLDFVWTLKKLTDDGRSMNIGNIIEVMKIRETAENLINDYWETARNEIRKGKSWNSLDQEQKNRFVKYLARKKTQKENNLDKLLEEQEQNSKVYEKEIEIAKYHEERGKKGCECWDCQEKNKIRAEAKTERKKFFDDCEKEQRVKNTEREKCPNCGKLVKELDEENGICKKCLAWYEGEGV